MILSTLCYLQQEDRYLMLHRVKKENDMNRDKWLGVGGKFEDGESPEECVIRECREETGLTLTDYRYRGIVTFVSDRWPTEYMHLFTADGFTGEIAKVIINQYKDVYPELERNAAFVMEQLALEETRFAKTLRQGEKEFEKIYNNVQNTKGILESILNADNKVSLFVKLDDEIIIINKHQEV